MKLDPKQYPILSKYPPEKVAEAVKKSIAQFGGDETIALRNLEFDLEERNYLATGGKD